MEIDIGVLGGAFLNGALRIKRFVPEFLQSFIIYKFCETVIINSLDFLNFVGCPKAVEEMQERQMCFNGGEVGYARQVHNFLYTVGCQEGKTGLPCSHNILVIAENGKGMACQRPCADMEDSR